MNCKYDLSASDLRAYASDRKRVKRSNLVSLLAEHKNNSKCAHCGSNKHLTFHHRDGEVKVANIHYFIQRISRCGLLREMAKCEILCRECHDVAHT